MVPKLFPLPKRMLGFAVVVRYERCLVGRTIAADGVICVLFVDGFLCVVVQLNNYPYCDGSHTAYNEANGTNFSPFKANKTELGKDTVYVCTCGQSKKRNEKGEPFCDGSHSAGPPK